MNTALGNAINQNARINMIKDLEISLYVALLLERNGTIKPVDGLRGIHTVIFAVSDTIASLSGADCVSHRNDGNTRIVSFKFGRFAANTSGDRFYATLDEIILHNANTLLDAMLYIKDMVYAPNFKI